MISDLTVDQQQLAKLMSEISERCYAAGWMQNLEYILWESLLKGEREYGQSRITTQDINALKALSETSNSWIYFDVRKEEIAVDLTGWLRKFQRRTQLRPEILGG